MAPMSKQNPLPFPGEEPQQTPADPAAASPSTGTGPNPVPPPAHARPAGRRPLWARLLGRLVEPWLALKIEPEDPGQHTVGRPVVFAPGLD